MNNGYVTEKVGELQNTHKFTWNSTMNIEHAIGQTKPSVISLLLSFFFGNRSEMLKILHKTKDSAELMQ